MTTLTAGATHDDTAPPMLVFARAGSATWRVGCALARVPIHGMTLVELVIGLAVGALVLTIAVPHFRGWVVAYELHSTAAQLAGSMTLARSEAIKRGYRVSLCKSTDRRRCADTGDWDRGWLVFADVDRDAQIGDDEVLVRIEDVTAPDISIRANRPLEDYVSYTSLGQARLLNGALQMGTFIVCRPGQNAIRVVLANSGRVRTERTRDPC